MAPPPFKTPPSPTGTWGQWCADRVARGLIGAALALPLRLRLRLVGGLVARGLAPLVGYQSRAMANLAYVWPHLSRAESRRIALLLMDINNVEIEKSRIKGKTVYRVKAGPFVLAIAQG